jgi:hypothetical protein
VKPTDADKSKAILKAREEREKEKRAVRDLEQTQTLVTEIEMLQVVMHLVGSRKRQFLILRISPALDKYNNLEGSL